MIGTNPDRDRQRSNARRFYANNREKVLERNRQWRIVNALAVREAGRKYQLENRVAIAEKQAHAYRKRGGKELDRTRLERRTAVTLMRKAKCNAKARRVEFSITRDWLEAQLSLGVCHISGARFAFEFKGRSRPFAPSIDRVVPALGYTNSNCRVILWCLNLGINDWGIETVLPAWEALIAKLKSGDSI